MTKKIRVNSTEQKILDFVKENYEVSTKDIVEFLGISAQATHKHLKKLVNIGKLKKMGNSPKVFYSLEKKSESSHFVDISLNLTDSFIEKNGISAELIETRDNIIKNAVKKLWLKNFIVINPDGKIIEDTKAFDFWCFKRGYKFEEKLEEYLNLQKKYAQLKTADGNFIIATEKFKNTFKNDVQLDEVYYCDFYSIEIFGKTKLGSLLLHGKQSQNLKIIHKVCVEVKDRILEFVDKNHIDAVAFIPPTTPRNPQFMDEFHKILNLKLPILKLAKIVNDVAVQQKTLKSAQDRIENAQNTIFVDEKRQFGNILLLDDAVGSGSTFNEIARKIRQKKLVQNKIFAIAIVGSANGIIDNQKKFEIINEV